MLRKIETQQEFQNLEQKFDDYPTPVLSEKLKVADKKDFPYFEKYLKILSKLKCRKSFTRINQYIDITTTYDDTLQILKRILHLETFRN